MKQAKYLIQLAFCLCAPILAATPEPPDTDSYDAVLKEYVLDNGDVRYGALRQDLKALSAFVDQIGAVSPESHPALFSSRDSQLAYWINTYNALVLWAFASEYPEKKDRLKGLIGRAAFFYRRKFQVGGEAMTLDGIEHDVIRKEFDEPRIHFAIVCASESCPWLSRDAYTATNLGELLERETKRFLNQKRNVVIDRDRRTVTLSKLFDWFREDFGATDAQVLAFVARYREDGAILTTPGEWKLRYVDYDWSVNDARD